MMDNYEQARLPTERLKDIGDIHQINFTEESVFEHVDVKTQNFNFGANILSTTTMSSSTLISAATSEEQIKTNAMNEIQTITLPPTLTTEDLQIVASSIADTPPVSVDEEAHDSEECTGGELTVEDIIHGGSSHTTDDIDNSQLSQESSQAGVEVSAKSCSINNDEDDADGDEDDEDSDDSSSDSDYSDLSGLSDMSGKEWKPISRPLNWVQKQIHSGANPREILSKFLPTSAQRISPELTDMTLWRILASMMAEPPRRKKLSYVNTFNDVIDLLQKSKNIIVLTGAGVSVSCGIPDFRSSDGIYSRLAKDFPNLPDPQAMFDINYFSRDPRPFFKFAREIYPGQFKPSPCHRFIKMLEQKQKLLRNYTQNIDTLEQVAGIKNVIECHGSFSTASCTKCKYKCDAESIRADIFAQRIPVCPRCQPNVEQSVDASQPVSELELRQLVENGIMKPDIVFFGEGLPEEFHTVMASDKDKCDLLIVMGSSLKVRPVALIPSSIPNNVPQILINREQLHHLEFDVELLGDGDVIINQICHRLGDDWKEICFDDQILHESKELMTLGEDERACESGVTKGTSHPSTDSISVKSNQSNDLNLQSGTTYSDSGFETSSTSSSKRDGEFLCPEYIEEPMESTDFGGSCDYRHLSIDSSKDSGIVGDGSNSAVTPVFNSSFSETGDTKKCLDMPATSTQAIPNKPTMPNNFDGPKTVANTEEDCQDSKQSIRRKQKRQSAGERLYKGTYYAHDLSASYVFPGAQVSWCSDSEEDDDDDDDEDDDDEVCDNTTKIDTEKHSVNIEEEDETANAATPSSASIKTVPTEHETNTFTNVITTNSTPTTSCSTSSPEQQQPKKRHSLDHPSDNSSYYKEEADNASTSTSSATVSTHSPPPHKKRRDSANTSLSPLSTGPSSQFVNTFNHNNHQ
ncbi:NAD-dependent histone deacetylase sirtuin-1 [Musca vetustissima]|uniref:NAD-dependent histone deacetylase sirtuin-1 n=1 Tax=Musca vetustissima TaxID=27455 RepID=UPI002AB75022|nr:NAD-dependent histone deacetylase sirtuin-1 [Musca vetustissima]